MEMVVVVVVMKIWCVLVFESTALCNWTESSKSAPLKN
jgi:hypothetical protein